MLDCKNMLKFIPPQQRQKKKMNNVREKLKAFIEKFYECDKVLRQLKIGKEHEEEDEGISIETGSYVEGAWCTPLMISIDGKMMDVDVMLVTCTINKTLSKFVLKETAHAGYYQVEMPLENHATLFKENGIDVQEVTELLRNVEQTKPQNWHDIYIDAEKGVGSDLFQVEIKDGRPSLCKTLTENMIMDNPFLELFGIMKSIFSAINYDKVPCIHLNFWPDIISPWFKKHRCWPHEKVVDEIRSKGCHLVWKAVDSEPACWCLSFSRAEVILAKERNIFQNKSYLLAKLIFTVQTQHLIDEEGEGRQLSSYLLKTSINFLLEETPNHVWATLEEKSDYFKVVCNLFQRLSKALNECYLPSFFSKEMNLLRGFTQPYLKAVSSVFDEFFKTDDALIAMLDCFKESPLCQIENK